MMKSALLTIFVSLLLISCKSENVVDTPNKNYGKGNANPGFYTDIKVLGRAAEKPLVTGDFFPDFLVNAGKEGEFSLSDLRGKVVFLEFWRTDCHFCVAAMPSLLGNVNAIEDKNFITIMVSLDQGQGNSQSVVKDFIDKFNMNNMVNIYDGRTLSTSLGNHASNKFTPDSYLIGKDGKVVRRLHPESSDFIDVVNSELAK